MVAKNKIDRTSQYDTKCIYCIKYVHIFCEMLHEYWDLKQGLG